MLKAIPSSLKRSAALLFIISLPFSTTSHATSQQAYQEALKHWSKVLTEFVDDKGRTDFIALKEKQDDLKKMVDFIASTNPKSHPELFPTRNDVLAYHSNAYNALAMHEVVKKKIPKNFSSFFKRAAFFKFRSVVIGGKKTNLYDYENRVIRPLNEPRIHFALNCMVKDCPRLPRQPFLAETLDKQLTSATVEFFTKDNHLRFDHNKNTAYLSWILDVYVDDFVESGKTKDLATYVNPYLSKPIPEDYKIKFIKYDWTVNQQPKI